MPVFTVPERRARLAAVPFGTALATLVLPGAEAPGHFHVVPSGVAFITCAPAASALALFSCALNLAALALAWSRAKAQTRHTEQSYAAVYLGLLGPRRK